MDDPLQAALLEHSTACHWVLGRDLEFIRVYGSAEGLLPLPDSVREMWCEKAAQAVAGQVCSWREVRGGRIYQVNLFPLPPAYAGGFAFEITPWTEGERQLREWALDVIRTRDDEQARLARFLHDEIGQALSAAGLQLDLLRMDLERTVSSISERTGEIQQVLETVMQRVRDLSHELSPVAAERVGLYPALDRLIGRLRQEFSGSLRFMADRTLRFPGPVAAAYYRVASYSLQMAVLQPGCTRIEVLVKSTREGPAIEVRDNGPAFDRDDPSAARRGASMLLLEQYAAQAGVRLSVTSRQGEGTSVKAVYNGGNEGIL
ncbi:MAG: histidine kinase [Acidobacteria bacterium]|nr:histidine kinase [Acidobacteriota bacterium]